ncbi:MULTISPECIES: hypothetical protein [Pseudomonas]|jgi:hypothetical protein|nr:hypothetical protein [Pseudomonas syringae]
MTELFWQQGAQIDRQHIHCAHSPQLTLSMVDARLFDTLERLV